MTEMVVKRGLAPAADKSGTATAHRTSGDSPRFVCLAAGVCPLLYASSCITPFSRIRETHPSRNFALLAS